MEMCSSYDVVVVSDADAVFARDADIGVAVNAAAQLAEPVIAFRQPPQDRRLPLRPDDTDDDVDAALVRFPAHTHLPVSTHIIVRTGAASWALAAWQA
jgi:hypothetical protein